MGIFDEEIVPLLERTPGIRAVTLFEELMRDKVEEKREVLLMEDDDIPF